MEKDLVMVGTEIELFINIDNKAMIYLNNVDINNGPFQYLKKSHKINNIIKFNYFLKKAILKNGLTIQKLINSKKLKLKITTVVANAGT